MKQLIFTLAVSMVCIHGQSQGCRFLDQVFPGIVQTNDIEYGVNATILYFPFYGEAIPEPLLLDLYEPAGDIEPLRPLVIYFHSGNFLPYPQNQGPVGTKRDSSSVEICRRFARSGYVTASADYRLGWNPLSTNPLELTIGLINAAYRGVQDANTCVRYFKMTVAEKGNPFRIDTSRIVLFGDDTGGYLSVHAGALDRYSKILESPQFVFPINDSTYLPMVFQHLSGDVEGKNYGVNTPQVTLFPFPPGDTLCYPNHVGYSSHFRAAVNLGGAVADTTWIDPGQPPIISAGTKYDKTTPYSCGIAYIGDLPVIHVCGPYGISKQSNAVGNNSILTPSKYTNGFQEDVTTVAINRNEELEGLLPVSGDTITDYNPWIFCDTTSNENCKNYLKLNPHMSREKAGRYIDTILAYVLPRLFLSLDLRNPSYECMILASDNILRNVIDIKLYPNPASQEIIVTAPNNYIIRNLKLFDNMGRLIQSYRNINETYYLLSVANLISGMYIVSFQFDQGITARQIVVK